MAGLLKKIFDSEVESLINAVQSGKEQVQNGELEKEEYEAYLRRTFQFYLERLFGIKIDCAIPN